MALSGVEREDSNTSPIKWSGFVAFIHSMCLNKLSLILMIINESN